jgi:hypothetical protein
MTAESAGTTSLAAEGMTAAMVPLAESAPHPDNRRIDVGELAGSIRMHGVLEPLVVISAAAFMAAHHRVPRLRGGIRAHEPRVTYSPMTGTPLPAYQSDQ